MGYFDSGNPYTFTSFNASLSNVNISSSGSVTIANINPERKAILLHNNTSTTAFISFGKKSSSTACTFILASFGNWQYTSFPMYVGAFSAITNAGTTGIITITELV